MSEKFENTAQQRRQMRLMSWFDSTASNWTQCERQFAGARDFILDPASHYRQDMDIFGASPEGYSEHAQRALGLFMEVVGKPVLTTLMDINAYDTVASVSMVLKRYLEKNFNPDEHAHPAETLFSQNPRQHDTIRFTFLNSVVIDLVNRAGGANPDQFLHYILNQMSLPYYLHAQIIENGRKHMVAAATLH